MFQLALHVYEITDYFDYKRLKGNKVQKQNGMVYYLSGVMSGRTDVRWEEMHNYNMMVMLRFSPVVRQ